MILLNKFIYYQYLKRRNLIEFGRISADVKSVSKSGYTFFLHNFK